MVVQAGNLIIKTVTDKILDVFTTFFSLNILPVSALGRPFPQKYYK